MKAQEIREKFLAFFKAHGHTVVPSSPLIPAEDPTLLFTNAGMNQFKDVFLGDEKRSYTRATSIQKCVRAGGKHNDFEQVGFSERHLTFFEMMGNFSFGDYFKKEAINFAWDFLTHDMKFNSDTLYPTVFTDDDESFDIWHTNIGIPKNRISRLGEADNFWAMGETGPCGPCSEILIDRGADKGCGKTTCKPGCDCPRYFELWNLVFMQYNRHADGTLTELAQRGVDTGMGFERLCMIAQEKNSVYEIDSFQELISYLEKHSGTTYDPTDQKHAVPFRVLSDHVRSVCLIIADGGTPSNDGRGYVLRKIIRRALLFAKKIANSPLIFVELAKYFITAYAPIYPELETNRPLILQILRSELERFDASLVQGQSMFERYVEETKQEKYATLSGEKVFKLYDTFGFPLELTSALAREHELGVDIEGFEAQMLRQQEQSGKKTEEHDRGPDVPHHILTDFVGYEQLEVKSPISFVEYENGYVWIVTDKTPFFVESGGQVNDRGTIAIENTIYDVVDLKKHGSKTDIRSIAVKLKCPFDAPKIVFGQIAHCRVNAEVRWNIVRNHTATHMLQAALIEVLGNTVKQAGSIVYDTHLRFDFTHHDALTDEEIARVENIINNKIQENIPSRVEYMTLEESKKRGVISFFGEKYNPEQVRVVEIPGFSAELCGGTHAPSTGIIGCFKITSDTALSTGVRRITAVTGPEAIRTFQQSFNTVSALSEQYKVKHGEVQGAAEREHTQYHHALSTIKQLKKQLWKVQVPLWAQQISTQTRVPFLYLEVEGLENNELKHIGQALEKHTPGFYFLVSRPDKQAEQCTFVGYASKKILSDIDLPAIAKTLREHSNLRGGGGGGGGGNIIQGGGPYSKDIRRILTNVLS